ncbi:hypothetical protein L1987_32452 [Smallanthus sonchifolius]|uniref:Uncharacterized protein n=1 Tax=Smallanthus sonchifolius TaxID=185202 RepID=A0ACB9HMM8_9ASTR|nr:hypothetical protein L1987_32452 [Smallanthus sonchifolius]
MDKMKQLPHYSHLQELPRVDACLFLTEKKAASTLSISLFVSLALTAVSTFHGQFLGGIDEMEISWRVIGRQFLNAFSHGQGVMLGLRAGVVRSGGVMVVSQREKEGCDGRCGGGGLGLKRQRMWWRWGSGSLRMRV